jgi:dTDP-4-dehydrorhamnose 3,5-epimerase
MSFCSPEFDRAIRWDDPDIGIDWPLANDEQPLLSAIDAAVAALKNANVHP